MILGRTVWKRDSSVWRIEQFDSGGESVIDTMARVGELTAESTSTRTSVVFEPEGMAHELLETPNVGRAVFATLARVRNEHPVVTSTNLGWGIEIPGQAANGTYSTIIHSEMAPCLVHLKCSCTKSRCRLLAAWSAYTVIEVVVRSRLASFRARRGIVITAGFVAVASCNSARRSFRTWVGKMSERDWKAFSALVADSEARPSAALGDLESRRSGIVVISDGDPSQSCPIWSELSASGRVKAVIGIGEFAECAAKVPVGHPGNLLEGFPTPLLLDPYLVAVAIVGISVSVMLGGSLLTEYRRFESTNRTVQKHIDELTAHISDLKGNERRMLVLRSEILDSSELLPTGKHRALVALAAAVPDAVTLTSFVIDRDDSFEIEAMVDRVSFNPGTTREAFANHGFAPDQVKGWIYDSADAMLYVRGRYLEHLQ